MLILEPLESRETPSTVTYHGGTILERPEVASLFLGNYRYDLDHLASVMATDYTSYLGVYGILPGARNGVAVLPDPGPITDAQVRQLLSQEIATGALPVPNGQNQAYAVYLTHPTEYGPAYHYWFRLNGVRVPYSVAPSTGSYYDPGPSHELVETFTDPFLNGWFAGSPQTGEVADLGHGHTFTLDGLHVVIPVGPDGAYITAPTAFAPVVTYSQQLANQANQLFVELSQAQDSATWWALAWQLYFLQLEYQFAVGVY